MLTVLASQEVLPALEEILFRETTTFGIRRYPASRHKLQRRACTVPTAWGPVQGKLGWQEGRPPVFSPEYESCARIAREHGLALRDVYLQAQRAFAEQAPNSGEGA
jgi:pyridinium-3,5-bisthiocarboxylic acid mononucleotide nickel chelatase